MDTKDLTAQRGDTYGDPLAHFATSEGLYRLWLEHFEHERELVRQDLIDDAGAVSAVRVITEAEALCVRHVAKFVIDKLTRAARSPKHVDHWDDVGGYARTAKMALRLLSDDDA